MRREVHYRIHPAQGSRECGHICNVSAYQFESICQKRMAGVKIVKDHNLVPTPPQRASRMASDVSRASNDENDQLIAPVFHRLAPESAPRLDAVMLQFTGQDALPNTCGKKGWHDFSY
jgi:hypothetical protein